MTTAADAISLKFARQFACLDSNADGYVDWADYQRLVERTTRVFGLSSEDRRYRSLAAFYQTAWTELLRHANAADRLNEEAFVRATQLAVADTSRIDIAEGSAHAIFDCVDVDGAEQIGQEELVTYLTAVWSIDRSDAAQSFLRLDADGDGYVSRQDFVSAVRAYYHSSDSGAAVNVLFGGS